MNIIVSKYKPLTGKSPPGEKCPGLEPVICFHNLYDDDNYYLVDESAILVKIEEDLLATKKNF